MRNWLEPVPIGFALAIATATPAVAQEPLELRPMIGETLSEFEARKASQGQKQAPAPLLKERSLRQPSSPLPTAPRPQQWPPFGPSSGTRAG